MVRVKFYQYAIWCLIGFNIAILIFFLIFRPQPRHSNPPVNFRSEVIEMLELNKEQTAQLHSLADSHTRQMTELSDQQYRLLSPYFASLITSAENSDKQSLVLEYQRIEQEKIELTYHHFKEIRELLNEDQLPYFEEFVRRSIDRILLDRKKGPPPPKDFD